MNEIGNIPINISITHGVQVQRGKDHVRNAAMLGVFLISETAAMMRCVAD